MLYVEYYLLVPLGIFVMIIRFWVIRLYDNKVTIANNFILFYATEDISLENLKNLFNNKRPNSKD